jgi:hypothetical protein
VLEGKSEDQARFSAARAFADERRYDEHVRRVVGETWEPGAPPPLAFAPRFSFEELSNTVFVPLLSHCERLA